MKKKIELKNVIVTRVMCAEMLGNSDVRATYKQSGLQQIRIETYWAELFKSG